MVDTPGTEQPESPVEGTPAATVTEEPKAPDEVATLREELAAMRDAHAEEKQQYESRIGSLVSANGDRQRDSDARIDALAGELERATDWQENVTRESLPPEERGAYDARQSARKLESLETRLNAQDDEVAARAQSETERGDAYNRAVQLGVPVNEIDYRSVQGIEDSVTRWQEAERNKGLETLKSDLANVQEELASTRKAAEDAARTGRGETAVPGVAGAPAVTVELGNTDLPKEAQTMLDDLTRELNRPQGKRDSGKILVLQRDLAEVYNLEIDIERT